MEFPYIGPKTFVQSNNLKQVVFINCFRGLVIVFQRKTHTSWKFGITIQIKYVQIDRKIGLVKLSNYKRYSLTPKIDWPNETYLFSNIFEEKILVVDRYYMKFLNLIRNTRNFTNGSLCTRNEIDGCVQFYPIGPD